MKIKDLKENRKALKELGQAIYKHSPYVMLNKDNVVLASGDEDYFLNDSLINIGNYYDECTIEIRTNDIYLHNNEKIDRVEIISDLQHIQNLTDKFRVLDINSKHNKDLCFDLLQAVNYLIQKVAA